MKGSAAAAVVSATGVNWSIHILYIHKHTCCEWLSEGKTGRVHRCYTSLGFFHKLRSSCSDCYSCADVNALIPTVCSTSVDRETLQVEQAYNLKRRFDLSLCVCPLTGDTEIYLRSEILCCAQEAAEFNLAQKPEPQPPLSAPSLVPAQSCRGLWAGMCRSLFGCEMMKDSINFDSPTHYGETTVETFSNLAHRKWHIISVYTHQASQCCRVPEKGDPLSFCCITT